MSNLKQVSPSHTTYTHTYAYSMPYTMWSLKRDTVGEKREIYIPMPTCYQPMYTSRENCIVSTSAYRSSTPNQLKIHTAQYSGSCAPY